MFFSLERRLLQLSLDLTQVAHFNGWMFEFFWPKSLRYVTYDCCPLANREMLVEIMAIAGVDAVELARRLDIDVSRVEGWISGEVRPRYDTLDAAALVCEVDIGPGFGEDSPQLDQRDEWSDADYAAHDPDPLLFDRADMESVGYISHSLSDWGSMIPGSRTNATGKEPEYVTMQLC